MKQEALPLECNPENEASLRVVWQRSPLPGLGYTFERAMADDAMKRCLVNLSRVMNQPFSYQPPVEKICVYCGVKHTGPFNACRSCQDAVNRGG